MLAIRPLRILRGARLPALFAAALLAGCAASGPAHRHAPSQDFGVLVMAHGGGETWNREVTAALAPLADELPLDIAFGMADAASLDESVRRLEARGVERVAVVRLFVSGESWYERTEQILGLVPGAPVKPAVAAVDHAQHGGHRMEFWRVPTAAAFALSTEGLAEAPEMGAVLAERAAALSSAPEREDVLILAHGPGDDAENARWLAHLEGRAEAVRAARPFRRVAVETLREDWADKRAAAEVRIRAFVERAGREGGRAIVVPYRVQGFGPYAEVLAGLDYASDGQGLVPHPRVLDWVRRQVAALRAGPFRRSADGLAGGAAAAETSAD